MTKTLLLATVALIAMATGAHAQAGPARLDAKACERAIEGHGFASRAQFQCGFAGYDEGRISDAAQCRAVVGEARTRQLLSQGFDVFDSQERKWGHKAWCNALLKDMPEFRGPARQQASNATSKTTEELIAVREARADTYTHTLIAQAHEANSDCRGRNVNCQLRERLVAQLKARGICWGPAHVIEAQKDWVGCK